MNNPLVSIIVRTKDRPKLLKRALQSIASQTYRPIEVVLVNDGGCDLDTEELKTMLGDVALNYMRLEKNMGRAHAGNIGIENAKGEYVGFLDDDDVYFPGGVKTLTTAALSARNRVIYGKVVCRKYADDDLSKVIEEREIGEMFDAGRLVLENFIPINALCVPLYLLRKIGLLDTGLNIFEDWDMMIRLTEAAAFQFVDSVVAEYSVIGSATITGKGGIETQNTYREIVLAKHIEKIKAHDFLAYLQSIIDRVVLEKDRRLHNLADFLKEKESLIKSLEESSAAKEERILRLEGDITAKEERILRLEGDITAKEEGILWLQGIVKIKEEKINALGATIRMEEEKIGKLEKSIKTKDEELSGAILRENELRKLLKEVIASDSWKLTKPLRAAGAAARKVISLLKHGT